MQVLDLVSEVLKQKGGQIWSINPKATVYDALRIMADKTSDLSSCSTATL